MSGLTLALSTASPALSLALFDGDARIAHDHRTIGRGHAEALMPAVAAMLAGRAPPVHVLVDIGPGSFTGIRIGIAAARALGLAWGVPVNGFSGAGLVAARAFAERPELTHVGVLLDAGRGQLLFGEFERDLALPAMHIMAASDVPGNVALAGAGTALLADAMSRDIVHAGLPDAAYALGLPLAARDLLPNAHYLRPPDAILPL